MINNDAQLDTGQSAAQYAAQVATQLRKGYLSYCVLKVCSHELIYTSTILSELRSAELAVVEGTIYPLLSRLLKDGLLQYEWQESEQGPPRKYYQTTDFGNAVCMRIGQEIEILNKTLQKL